MRLYAYIMSLCDGERVELLWLACVRGAPQADGGGVARCMREACVSRMLSARAGASRPAHGAAHKSIRPHAVARQLPQLHAYRRTLGEVVL